MTNQTSRETAWLIEATWPEGNRPPTPQWWHPQHGWMWNADKAIRFAREVDAQDYIGTTPRLTGKPTEHVFCRGGLQERLISARKHLRYGQ